MPTRRIKPEELFLQELDKIKNMYASGYTMSQIAGEFGYSEKTLSRAAKANPSILDALKKGKKEAILDVEKSLYTLAVGGFIVKKKKTIWVPDRQDPSKMVIEKVEETEDTLAPNIAAQVFYLKNNAPDRYQDKRVIEQSSFTDNLDVVTKLMTEVADDVKSETIVQE